MEHKRLLSLKKFGELLNLDPNIMTFNDTPEIQVVTTYNTIGDPCGWIVLTEIDEAQVFVSMSKNIRIFKTLNAIHNAMLSIGAWKFSVYTVK